MAIGTTEPGATDAPAPGPSAARRAGSDDVPDDLSELRTLILGAEHARRIDALYARLENPEVMARAIGPVLPDAIARRGRDPMLARALEPSIEHALTASVRRNPHPLADALFPVIGPAIRNAIAHTLGTMFETFNRTLEQSMSWRALRWRIEAMRTGRPFSEVVLLHTLEYRVEQVFLIHRESGLLLQHAAAESLAVQGADMVSAMLTAIRDFVRDSFGVGTTDGLDALRVGELSVLIVQGPHAILAGVVRGTAPPDARVPLQDALETVHLQYATDLAAFAGDSGPFDAARPILEACLVSQHKSKRGRRGFALSWRWAAAGLVGAAALAWWLGLSIRDGRRWDRYLDRLRSEPGILVLDAGRRGRTFTVSGLRDPLAPDPASFVAAASLSPERVDGRWQFYQALDPPFVIRRARTVLRPPDGVTLHIESGVLTVAGDVPPAWAHDAERLAPMIAGVRELDPNVAPAAARALAARLERASLRFVRGRAELVPGQEAAVAEVTAILRQADDFARAVGRPVEVRLVGHADADGPDDLNLPLSRARARTALALVAAARFTGLAFVPDGVGSSQPVATDGTDAAKQLNRRVSFAVAPGAVGGAR
jgi:OOP family OmpA-OmpF porin